ncbi:MAG: hypothetical protein IT374_03580 [Polyangiaceae bacterium]|nr:hypothetical protein [Polyangiaceae bacterium]
MKLVAMVTDPNRVGAYLRSIGEPCGVPERSPSRGRRAGEAPYWRSAVLRRKAGHGDHACA